ncbi:nuclear transport factor 2 family protein [Alteromonas gilva]|uniref:Nuclear transport factor 2 family protein n=1 Tax=Alteromonas gilva TaxID=2987522 RepID=A0ABT5L6W4_9ALTE|nr:nuclear transport factor 2 family protein [Alteromonas gilva]MDC8832785.1 nuclear transport factor 2 family protein [Alteromonas gilva]
MSFKEQFVNLYRDLAQIDIEDLASIYHQDVVFIDPVTTHHGLTAVNTYFKGLLDATESCQFEINNWHNIASNDSHQNASSAMDCSDVLEWTMKLKLSGKPNWIELAGVTLLKVVDDKILYHRDYYDLGEMVYEHIPLLKHIIKFIKKKLLS